MALEEMETLESLHSHSSTVYIYHCALDGYPTPLPLCLAPPAPQVIRKIRGEPFPDASGHLKLWCQFFNVLSDSTIKWYRDEEEILEVKRR